jgi:hypothetical protein
MVDNFPVFLKTSDERNYYCILSNLHFWEWQRVGSKGILLEIQANTLPDRWVIQDLLTNANGNIVASSQEEWQMFTKEH